MTSLMRTIRALAVAALAGGLLAGPAAASASAASPAASVSCPIPLVAAGQVVHPACGGGGLGTPPCTGPSCVGLDPDVTGCDRDAQPLQDATNVNGETVELRWSAWCQANWALITKGSGETFFAQSGDQHEEFSSTPIWSAMVDGTQVARACVKNPGYYAGYACTGWW
jgi:hypothetical protein